jgi:hypothetical protein
LATAIFITSYTMKEDYNMISQLGGYYSYYRL